MGDKFFIRKKLKGVHPWHVADGATTLCGWDYSQSNAKFAFAEELSDGARICVNCEALQEVSTGVVPRAAKTGRLHFYKSPEFLKTYEWRRLRMEVLTTYGAVCMCCGASPWTGAMICVDHIKPRATHPHLALEFSNLQVLCEECNHGKGNWNTTDWRGAAKQSAPLLITQVEDARREFEIEAEAASQVDHQILEEEPWLASLFRH